MFLNIIFYIFIEFSLFLSLSQAEERRRGSHTESNGFGNHGNHGNLPDLVQQSNSPSATPTTALQELADMAEVRHARTHTHNVHAHSHPFMDIDLYLKHGRWKFKMKCLMWTDIMSYTESLYFSPNSLVWVGPKRPLPHLLIHVSTKHPRVKTTKITQQKVRKRRRKNYGSFG